MLLIASPSGDVRRSSLSFGSQIYKLNEELQGSQGEVLCVIGVIWFQHIRVTIVSTPFCRRILSVIFRVVGYVVEGRSNLERLCRHDELLRIWPARDHRRVDFQMLRHHFRRRMFKPV